MENREFDVFIFAGESSADQHGAKVLEELYAIRPGVKVFGVGGPKMRKVGMTSVKTMEDFQVMGFIDVLKELPRLIKQFYLIAKTILQKNPKVVLLIDYPGFNLRLASYLRKKKFSGKICQFVSPSVWAWKKDRIETMVKSLDVLFSILPFEVDFFALVPLQVIYVGNPLVQEIAEEKQEEIPALKNQHCIALFPGSREKEIVRNFPIMLRVAKRLLRKHPDLMFGISVSHEKFFDIIEQMLEEEAQEVDERFVFIFPEKNYALMRCSTFAIAKSGTVTLELALHGIFTIVTYAISFLDLWIAKYLFRIRLPYYCIVNIICGRKVFPEFIGPACTEHNLYAAAKHYIEEKLPKEQFAADCQYLKKLLQDKKAGKEVALHLNRFLE